MKIVCYILKYLEYSGGTQKKPLCSDSSKIGKSPLHGVQRDVNYKRFWEYFRIFEQFQSIFGPQLDTLNSKIGLETPKLLIFNIFQTDRLDFNFIFWDFFLVQKSIGMVENTKISVKNEIMYFVGFVNCTREKCRNIFYY